MIIDQRTVAGLEAYLRNPDSPNDVNLGGPAPRTARTSPIGEGKLLEIAGIQVCIEAEDLAPLFFRQPTALLSITIMKELFPGLFADAYRNRVHAITGFDDLSRGSVENGRIMEYEGAPTLVSMGEGTCRWTSPVYRMPERMALVAGAWDLATSRQTPAEAFSYSLSLRYWTDGDDQQASSPHQPVMLADSADPQASRAKEGMALADVRAYQVEFTADVRHDAALHERHTPILGESMGRPLLRSINLLEPVASPFEFHSLNELLQSSDDYHLFESGSGPIKRVLVDLELAATLVRSDFAPEREEYLEFAVKHGGFDHIEARLDAIERVRPPRP